MKSAVLKKRAKTPVNVMRCCLGSARGKTRADARQGIARGEAAATNDARRSPMAVSVSPALLAALRYTPSRYAAIVAVVQLEQPEELHAP
jgi:hypothetical protein